MMMIFNDENATRICTNTLASTISYKETSFQYKPGLFAKEIWNYSISIKTREREFYLKYKFKTDLATDLKRLDKRLEICI